MKLIGTAKKLESEFIRLLTSYPKYYWATAWAGPSKISKLLLENDDRISKLVVGIHFYQTHPTFIRDFIDNKKVRFLQQPSGTFHPKIYLFYQSPKNWELLLGSPNFTNKAFTENTEASVLISSHDPDSALILGQVKKMIEDEWEKGKVFSETDFEKYEAIWKIQSMKIKSLSGLYGGMRDPKKSVMDSHIQTLTWQEYLYQLSQTDYNLEEPLAVLKLARELFSKNSFQSLDPEARKFIAGFPNEMSHPVGNHWGYFGSMKGSGVFNNLLGSSSISKALDQIPYTGTITRSQYDSFVKAFQSTFKGTRLDGANNLGTATRLLCLKRPDTFICFNSRNRSRLCKDFGIVQSGMNFDRYWNDIILRIYDSSWWQFPKPKNSFEQQISECRVAFLDMFYYDGKNLE